MKYIVVEIQTNDGQVSTLVTQKDTLNEAQSVYHSVLAAAALSSVDFHAAVLMTNEGISLYSDGFSHKSLDE